MEVIHMTVTKNQNEYRCLTPKEIGEAVEMIRKTVGMKQLTLALQAGVTERTVQRIENGEKVNDETLQRIAKAFRMEDGSFLGPREVLSKEEAWEAAEKRLKTLKVIDACGFATLKDAEAVLGTHGSVIDDHNVTDEAAEELAEFKDQLHDWNDVYLVLDSQQEKWNACRSLLQSAKKLEARGYVIRYGVYTTDDGLRIVTMLLARKVDSMLCQVKQLLVPMRFTEMTWD
jgi:transcriptional regulator with XRE-family HTH domain